LIPNNIKHILFVVASFRISRLKFLCERILGDQYTFDFESIPSEQSPIYDEPHTFKIQSDFLKPMKDGEHQWLADKFYSSSLYNYWRMYDKDKGTA
jgi:hypothetical protein